MKATVCIRRAVRGCVGPTLLAGVALAADAVAKAQYDIRDIRGPKAMPAVSWVVLAVIV